jgi:hypothetical protein
MRTSKHLAALCLSGALVAAANAPTSAAPITALSAAAKPATVSTDAVQQVRFGGFHGGFHGGFGGWHGGWRGGGWGWGAGALAAGALIGAGIAASSPYYWDDPYYYGPPYGYRVVSYPPYWGYPPYPYWRRRVWGYYGPWW